MIYDLVLLLIPIAYLLGRDGRDRLAAAFLYGSAEIAQVYDVTGFSVVPVFSFFAMGCVAFGRAAQEHGGGSGTDDSYPKEVTSTGEADDDGGL